ncbi:AEC family transporter [Halomonas elongata]|uniref:AEC family transport protein n=1 Tax=Halomonas elongata (strain ATCC 33173 / DSM 2581 / NBRC 15536 / NCIMB 2198 / 1H9) TaxID=768066 RepID=E1V6S3_HALED|nr:AEC family transporter [Halomonas elongata]MDL4860946.1 AEC family transporter [Halomonas elongata]WBF17054.1 AEC family transporter [Halomonas elongata]WPU45886.1 AEC family transporter [Halomonas elongata DSM 2581]CBV43302.1 AEC family transport protein [Halomonas elongata DSM 2581]
MSLIDIFLGTLGITLPVFAMVFIGIGLKRLGWIDQAFVNTASRLVFRGTLPTLIFLSLIGADLENTFNPWLLVFFALATLASFLLSWAWSTWRHPRHLRGVYVQGAFRGNCGIVGMALASGMYGEAGLSIGGLLLGVVILTYNVLSVVVLSFYRPRENGARQVQWRSIAKHILTNPLILAVLLATPLALLEVRLPHWLATTGDYFASLTLPLALICIGATLSTRALKKGYGPALGASTWKMVGIPFMATAAAWSLGFEGRELGVMFLFFASPTAAAAFVMAKAMGGDETLTANIIALTTLMASITITAGVFVLRVAGLI